MPTPEHERSLPVHVEIPELPEAMQQWFDFVHRAEDGELMLCRWRERWIDLLYVVDGLSAAHVLGAYRYAVTDGEWVDLVGDEPGDWRREWIAIASEDGVPFIADISSPVCRCISRGRSAPVKWILCTMALLSSSTRSRSFRCAS